MWEPENKWSCRPSVCQKSYGISFKWCTAIFWMHNSHLASTVFRFPSLASRIAFLPIIQVIGTKFISRLTELYCKCHRYRKYPLSKYHCPVWKDLKKCPVLKVNCVKIKSRGNLVLSTEFFLLDNDQNFTQCKH